MHVQTHADPHEDPHLRGNIVTILNISTDLVGASDSCATNGSTSQFSKTDKKQGNLDLTDHLACRQKLQWGLASAHFCKSWFSVPACDSSDPLKTLDQQFPAKTCAHSVTQRRNCYRGTFIRERKSLMTTQNDTLQNQTTTPLTT